MITRISIKFFTQITKINRITAPQAGKYFFRIILLSLSFFVYATSIYAADPITAKTEMDIDRYYKEQKLWLAVRNGNLKLVEEIVFKTRGILAENPSVALNILDVATVNDYPSIAKFLLEQGANVGATVTNYSGTHPVDRAIYLENVQILSLFIKHGANLNKFDHSTTPLDNAIRTANRPLVDMVLEGGADPQAQMSTTGRTPLTTAAHLGLTNIANSIYARIKKPTLIDQLACGLTSNVIACINADPRIVTHVDKWGNTLLHWAAWTYQPIIVECLTKKGAAINMPNTWGYTPLRLACEQRDKKSLSYASDDLTVRVANILLANGANPASGKDDQVTKVPWCAAVNQGSPRLVDALLTAGLRYDVKNRINESLLHCVCSSYNDASLVSKLISHGVEVNGQDDRGWTPLHSAAIHDSDQAVEQLLRHGARVDAQNIYGETPLHIASRYFSTNVMFQLIKSGADINAQATDGNTPLHILLSRVPKLHEPRVSLNLIKHLIASGANIKIKNKKGEGIHNFARDHQLTPEISIYLFQNGCDIDHVTKEDARFEHEGEEALLKTLADLGSPNAFWNIGDLHKKRGSATLASDSYYSAGMLFADQGDRSMALRQVECLNENGDRGLAAKLREQIYNNPKKANPNLQKQSCGTGWLVGKGLVVTCYHVVNGKTNITLYSKNKNMMTGKIVASDMANDLVIIQIDGAQPPGMPHLQISDSIALGAKVFTVGFPHIDVMGLSAKVTDGIVSSLSGIADDTRTMQVSVPVQGGNSGGPLVNLKGEVVGVIMSKLDAQQVYKYTGDLPENVSYAIKSSFVRKLLETVNQGFNVQKIGTVHETPAGSFEDVVKQTESAVLVVVAGE